jgi:hypothetical protein
MSEHVYKIVELAGSSAEGFEDAIAGAIAQAAESLRHLRWFEVSEMRGHIEDGKVKHYQVVLRVGFTLEQS